MVGKGTTKKQTWVHIAFLAVFFGIATLFVMPAEAQNTGQVNVNVLGENAIRTVLPSVDATDSTQTDQGLQQADTLVRNVLQLVLRILQFAAIVYIVYIGAQIVMNVSNEDLLEKKRPAIAYAIVGFVVMSIGDQAINIFNPANFASGGTLEGQLVTGIQPVIGNVIDVMRYALWVIAVALVMITGYRMVISQDKDVTKSRQQLVWIGIGLFVVQIADFIVTPFTGSSLAAVDQGNALIANITNVLLTFFAPAAFFMFLYGAFVLVTAQGDEGKLKTARNILIGTLIAVIITFSSMAIIGEVVRSFSST